MCIAQESCSSTGINLNVGAGDVWVLGRIHRMVCCIWMVFCMQLLHSSSDAAGGTDMVLEVMFRR